MVDEINCYHGSLYLLNISETPPTKKTRTPPPENQDFEWLFSKQSRLTWCNTIFLKVMLI